MTKSKAYRNICDVIVPNGYCVGCGICAGICPSHVLEMKLNEYGEYQPLEVRAGCLPACDLCFRSCPFWNQADNEDTLAKAAFGNEPGINHSGEIGFHLDSYVGYSNVDGHRVHGASGGLATWLLETMLGEGLVDHVICVVHNPDPKRLYKFSVLHSVEEIRGASRSCYYPVELSEVIDYILQHEGDYAIIGLPCFLKGLRLAARSSARLRRRMKFLLGLVCGQQKSTFFAAHLCALKGGDPWHMDYCCFRVKDQNRRANDFGFSFKCTEGAVRSDTIYWTEGMREAWTSGFFKLNACNYCDDVYAELADVTFMDAWLNRYIEDPAGTNIVLFRNIVLRNLALKCSSEGLIHLEPLSIDCVVKSQQAVLDTKRARLANRLRLAKVMGRKYLPIKRVSPSKFDPISLFERFLEQNVNSNSKKMMAGPGIIEGRARLNQKLRAALFLLRLIDRFRRRLTIWLSALRMVKNE